MNSIYLLLGSEGALADRALAKLVAQSKEENSEITTIAASDALPGDIADALGVTIAFFFEGLAEGDVPKAPGADLMADKEALELVRSYYAIPEAQRRRLFDLARVLSDAA